MLNLHKKYVPTDFESNIEIHVSHSCNLTCQSCNHYSNHGHKGQLSLQEFEDWTIPWSRRIKPNWFSIMGGEPTMNQELTKITEKSAKIWGGSRIRIITNGFFLKNHPHLPRIMEKHNVQLRLSVHDDTKEFEEKINPVRELVKKWQKNHPRLQVNWTNSFKNTWKQTYKGFGNEMMPFEDNNPGESWNKCSVKFCRQIFLGKLWKCPNVAYLQMQDKKFKLNEKWLPYLGYRDGNLQGQALEPRATYSEIKDFYEQKQIFHCSMCPSKIIRIENFPSPLIPVSQLLKNNK
jgi:organic radical activating enzyme